MFTGILTHSNVSQEGKCPQKAQTRVDVSKSDLQEADSVFILLSSGKKGGKRFRTSRTTNTHPGLLWSRLKKNRDAWRCDAER